MYIQRIKQTLLFLAVALVMASCGARKGYFKIEGRFLNMNQGELYVYSPDGAINGIDTIKVNGGRFAIELPCKNKATLMIIFPNFSEQPIFAEPGKSVDIKADASHLKQMEVTGTDDNELMTDFRQGAATASPPEVSRLAENFIRDNAESPVAVYLIGRYFVKSGNASSLKKAKELLGIVSKAQPKNGTVARMETNVRMMLKAGVGSILPAFSATDVNGKPVSKSMLTGKKAIIMTWASWSYDSQDMVRKVNDILKDAGGNATAIGICVDASSKSCRDQIKNEGFTFPNICDGMLFDSNIMATLGMHSVPDNIIVNAAGKVVARGVATDDLEKYLK